MKKKVAPPTLYGFAAEEQNLLLARPGLADYYHKKMQKELATPYNENSSSSKEVSPSRKKDKVRGNNYDRNKVDSTNVQKPDGE